MHRWIAFVLLVLLLHVPAFSLTDEEALVKLADRSVYTQDGLTLWRVPMGFDGRELIFSMGELVQTSSLSSVGQGAKGVELHWESVQDAAFYTVFFHDEMSWQPLGQVYINQYIDEEIPALSPRFYRVTAHSERDGRIRSSYPSSEIRAERLGRLSELEVSYGGGVLLLSWEQSEGADGYFVYQENERILQQEEHSFVVAMDVPEEDTLYSVTPFYMDGETEVLGEPASLSITPEMKERAFITRIVNKKHPNDPIDYRPDDLVSVGSYGEYLREEAAEAFNEMNEAASAEGYPLSASSGFRDYDLQRIIHNRYVNSYGQATADQFSARPGYSEHQTGLTMDIVGGGAWIGSGGGFEYTGQYRWLREHAHEYGWVLRYPEGCDDVTGYHFEPWHWRYIGVSEATRFWESGKETLEAFYSIEGGDYE